jgi:SAM-dependent methyltransferase
LTIAELIGPDGTVVGTDLVPEMVEAARREGQRRGLHNASFETAFAESLPFPDGAFDAVVSRFGVMFFPSPADSVREFLRVLKPGGKIALAVWHFAEKNPFFFVVSRVVERYIASPPAEPDSPDAFRFAERGKLRHGSGCCALRYEPPFRRRTIGSCATRCQTSFAQKPPRFRKSNSRNSSGKSSMRSKRMLPAGKLFFPPRCLL